MRPLSYVRNRKAKLHKILRSLHVDCGHVSVLLRRHCDILCTSGFVDVVMFLHNGSYGASCIVITRQWFHLDQSQNTNHKSYLASRTQPPVCSSVTKSARIRVLVPFDFGPRQLNGAPGLIALLLSLLLCWPRP